jgi:DNA-binding HxlR family transcriptional regulator
VEYCLTDWGQRLCPVLDAFLKWADLRPSDTASDQNDMVRETNVVKIALPQKGE